MAGVKVKNPKPYLHLATKQLNYAVTVLCSFLTSMFTVYALCLQQQQQQFLLAKEMQTI